MAVTFKVPASPKRDVFTIDEFLGVDLTNTGTNIDPRRSPNAENMVRWTPGKVRKRTGYKTNGYFRKDLEDVNRAKNTSDDWEELDFSGSSYPTIDLYEGIYRGYIYIEFKYKGKFRISYITNSGSTMGEEFYSRNEWTRIHAAMDGPSILRKIQIRNYEMWGVDDPYCYIRRVRVCATTSATTETEWKALNWEPAPEDVGGFCVDSSITDNTVYGAHIYKDNHFVGNRVVNVNRALNTSDEYQTFNVPDAYYLEIYDVAPVDSRKMYVEFDVESTTFVSNGDLYITIGTDHPTSTNKGVQISLNAYRQENHYSLAIDVEVTPTDHAPVKVFFWNEGRYSSDYATVNIKNFALLYEVDDNYEWSPAPEDDGETFHYEDVYKQTDSYNLANRGESYNTIDQGTVASGSFYSARVQIVTNVPIRDYTYTSVDLLFSPTGSPVESITIRLEDSTGIIDDSEVVLSGDTQSYKYEYYGYTNRASHMRVRYTFDGVITDTTFTTYFRNISIYQITDTSLYYKSNKNIIYHVGSRFYLHPEGASNAEAIYLSANNGRSKSWQLNDSLYIIDGSALYKYTRDSDIESLTEGNGYTPLITISKSPSGGGTSYEPINLLSEWFYEQFIVTSEEAASVEFQLSLDNLDPDYIFVWVLDALGVWSENYDFVFDAALGKITFLTAPGETPITGEDNVRVMARKNFTGYKEKIANCTVGTIYGVGGTMDRLFLSGNPDYPNMDFFSEINDPSYFPDTNYSVLGSTASSIMGYAIVNGYLATVKNDVDTARAIYIREGSITTDETTGVTDVVFKIVNILQGEGAISSNAFGYLNTEPLFLTKLGVFALTPQDITGERYSQNRSFYLNGALLKEENLEDAIATIYKDQYVLALNEKLYILDGLQAYTEKSDPYSTRQYAGFYCTNVPAYSMWVNDIALCIGTEDGRVAIFEEDIDSLTSYSDDGTEIYCCWETPDLDGKLFYKNKTFRYFAIRMMSAIRTSVKIFSKKLGNWSFIKEDTTTGIYFDFDYIDFERFTFSNDRSERVAHTKVRVKKVDKARFRVENGAVNEPFGLVDLALEYVESGNYKG